MESPSLSSPVVPEPLLRGQEWQRRVLKVQAHLFEVLSRTARERFGQNFTGSPFMMKLISKLSDQLREFFNMRFDEGMSPDEFEAQFGHDDGPLRLLALALPGKSVDQILQECLNELTSPHKYLARTGVDPLRMRTSLAALLAVSPR